MNCTRDSGRVLKALGLCFETNNGKSCYSPANLYHSLKCTLDDLASEASGVVVRKGNTRVLCGVSHPSISGEVGLKSDAAYSNIQYAPQDTH